MLEEGGGVGGEEGAVRCLVMFFELQSFGSCSPKHDSEVPVDRNIDLEVTIHVLAYIEQHVIDCSDMSDCHVITIIYRVLKFNVAETLSETMPPRRWFLEPIILRLVS